MSDLITPEKNIDSLDATKERVMSANNANEIYEHLKQLGNDPKHRQRWIWELMQNAQDVAIDNSIAVQIIFNGTEVTFTHNGQAFTEEDITHLIYHGSSKPGLAGKTGKFGTGFMTTHLLSKKVKVKGDLADGRFFDFILDREATDGDDMLEVLDASWQGFKNSLTSNGTPGITSYTYFSLSDADILATVEPVLSAMRYLMPAVMAFSGIIKSVEVINRSTKQLFSISETLTKDEIHVQCSFPEQQSVFLIRDLPEHRTRIAIPIDTFGKIMPLETNIARLYITFPLVGTDQAFPLPFLIHSQNFEPNKEREKIWIEADTPETSINKRILEAAFSAYYECCAVITSKDNYQDTHLLANMGKLPSTDWLNKEWYSLQLTTLFEKLDQLPLVVSNLEGKRIPLKEAIVPYADEEVFDSLWNAWNYLHQAKIPTLTMSRYWKTVIEDRTTFSENSKHIAARELIDLCKEIDNIQDATVNSIVVTGITSIEFLVYLVQLIELSKLQTLWTEFAVLPNQNGKLLKSGFLQSEDTEEDSIGDHLKNISLGLDLDVRNKLLHSLINILSVDHQLQIYKKSTLVNMLLEKVKAADMTVTNAVFQLNSGFLLEWLLLNDRQSSVPGFPILMHSGKWEKCALGTDLLLAPVSLWPSDFQQFEDLFPPDFVLAEAYAFIFAQDALLLKATEWLLKEPLHYRPENIKPENIRHLVTKREDRDKLANSKTGEWLMTGTIMLSHIAYLNRPQDKSVIDRVRGSIKRTKQLLEFITCVLLYADQKGLTRTEIDVTSEEQAIRVSVFPSSWMRDLKVREWIKSKVSSGSADRPSVESLLPYFDNTEDNNTLYLSLQKPEVARWLHFLDIGVGDLLRNIRSGDNEDEKMNWDQSYVSILMNDRLTPEKVTAILSDNELLISYENKKRDQEQRRKNQEIGTMVEEAFHKAIEGLPGYRIRREPIGSDYVIESDDDHYLLIDRPNKKSFTIEIKSSRTVQVKMTKRQGETAQDKKDNYILCVVPINEEVIDAAFIRKEARFVTDIAILLDSRVTNVKNLEAMKENTSNTNLGEQVWTTIDGMDVRYVVGQAIWSTTRNGVLDFQTLLVDKII